MNTGLHSAAIVAVAAIVTILLRFAPFAVFRRNVPEAVRYLGRVLPYAAMALLVVYCLKGVDFGMFRGWGPMAAGVAVTAALYKWKHNTLLSIIAGTICYMILIRL